LVLDAGALVALDRRRRDVWALLAAALADDEEILVLAPVVAQVWRDPDDLHRLRRAGAAALSVLAV